MSNENIVHVEAIENLFSSINNHLDKLTATDIKQRTARDQMVEEVDLMQKDTLHDLRVVFE